MKTNFKNSRLLRASLFLFVVFLAIYFLNFLFQNSEEASVKNISAQVKDYCVENATKFKGKENCYSEEFKKLAERNGQEESFKILNNLQAIDPDAIGCHLIAHGIGWGSYKREPDKWRTLVQTMPTICNYGAIHGVVESYILSLPDKSLKREVIPTICGDQPRADCNHIVGHLLLVETEANVDQALNLCGVLVQVEQKRYCISGVFMEFQTALNLVDHDLVPDSWLNWPPRLPELEKLCRSYSGENASGCWEEIVHVAAAAFGNDPKKVFGLCSSAQVKDGAQRCKRHSIGVLGASKNFDLPSLKYFCTISQEDDDPNFEKDCYTNLVSSALSTIPTKVPEAVSFCNGLEIEYQKSCFSMIGGVGSAVPAVKQMLPDSCNLAPVEYRDYCLGSARDYSQEQIIRSND